MSTPKVKARKMLAHVYHAALVYADFSHGLRKGNIQLAAFYAGYKYAIGIKTKGAK